MNKHLTLLAAGAMLALAACNGGKDTGAGTMTQAQIDSAVAARTAEQEARIQRNNDSLINAMAQMRADSMINAGMQKSGTQAGSVANSTVKNTTHTSKTTTPKPKTETQKVNDIFNNNKSDKDKTKQQKTEEKKVNDIFH